MTIFMGLCRKHWKDLMTQKKRNALMFFLPILIMGVIYLFFQGSGVEKSFIQPIQIGVFDMDKSMYSRALVNNYKSNESFTDFTQIHVGGEELVTAYDKGQLDALILIPEKFALALMQFEEIPVVVRIAYTDPLKAVLFQQVMESYEKFITSVQVGVELLYHEMTQLSLPEKEIDMENVGLSYELIMTALNRNDLFTYKDMTTIPSTSSIHYFFVAILMMFLLYISVFVATDLLKEQDCMCLKRIQASTLSTTSYLVSKWIVSTLFIGGMVCLWYGVIASFSPLTLGDHFVGIILYIFTCIALAISIAIGIASLCKQVEQVILVSHIFIFVNGILGGSLIPLHYMPTTLRSLAKFTPNYWMIRGMLHLHMGTRIEESYMLAGGMAVLSAVLLWGAGRLLVKRSRRG